MAARAPSGTAALVVCALAAPPAGAWDWTGTAGFSQRVQGGGGIDTESSSDGLDSQTSLNLGLAANSGRTQIRLTPGLSFFASTDETFEADSIRPSFSSSISHGGLRTRLNGAFSFTPRFVPFSGAPDDPFDGFDDGDDGDDGDDEGDEGDDSSRRRSDSLELNTNLSLGLSHSIDQVNAISLGTFFRRRDYTNSSEDLSPSTSYGANAAWSRQASELTSLSLTATAQQFLPDDSDRDDSVTISLSPGFDTRLTPDLAVGGSLGLSATESAGETDIGVVGSFDLGYTLGPTRSISASVAQSVEEDTDGDVSNILSASLGYSQSLTGRSTFSASARATSENPLFAAGEDGDDRVTFALTPSFSYQITQDWRLSLSYSLRLEQEGGEDDVSSRATLQIGRAFDLF